MNDMVIFVEKKVGNRFVKILVKRRDGLGEVKDVVVEIVIELVVDFLFELNKFDYVIKKLWYRGIGDLSYKLILFLF